MTALCLSLAIWSLSASGTAIAPAAAASAGTPVDVVSEIEWSTAEEAPAEPQLRPLVTAVLPPHHGPLCRRPFQASNTIPGNVPNPVGSWWQRSYLAYRQNYLAEQGFDYRRVFDYPWDNRAAPRCACGPRPLGFASPEMLPTPAGALAPPAAPAQGE